MYRNTKEDRYHEEGQNNQISCADKSLQVNMVGRVFPNFLTQTFMFTSPQTDSFTNFFEAIIRKIKSIDDSSAEDFAHISVETQAEELLHMSLNYKNLNINEILDAISYRIQSGAFIRPNDIIVKVTVTRYVIGHHQTEDFNGKKLPRYFFKNDPSYKSCFFDSTAYVILKYHSIGQQKPHKEQIYAKAREIARRANVSYAAVGFIEIKAVENVLNQPIYVFDNTGSIFYKSSLDHNSIKNVHIIHLLYEKNCFFALRNPMQALNHRVRPTTTFCYLCCEFIKMFNKHKCTMFCPSCRTHKCDKQSTDIDSKTCESCNRNFQTESCFEIHKSSTCGKINYCPVCDVTYEKTYHDCFVSLCTTCYAKYSTNESHECIMTPNKLKSLKNRTIISYYDIETSLDTNNVFTPNLLISHTVCTDCEVLCDDIESDFHCSHHGCMEQIFESSNDKYFCATSYINYLLDLEKKHPKYNIIVLAHNNSAFDGCFMYETLLERYPESIFRTDPVKNGNKIITFSIGKRISFKDSKLYIPQALKNLPKIFGYESRMMKGFFPYRFYKRENLDYIGPIPDKKFFEEDKMKPNDRALFEEFYTEKTKTVYNLRDEAIIYCRNDVFLLRCCFQKFRRDIIKHFGIDPAVDCLTVASTCLSIFLNCFLNNSKIVSIDRKWDRPHSIEAITWIQIIEDELSYKLIHARKFQGEKRLKLSSGKIIFADGFDPTTNTVYSYHGCFWHCCPRCGYQNIIRNGLSGREIYEKTLSLNLAIEKEYNHVIIWGHEIHDRLKYDSDFKEKWEVYYKNNSCNHYKLNPGDSLYGGRTNPFRLYVSRQEMLDSDSKIEYLDFCSLYPYVMKNRSFPVGVPTIITKNELPSVKEFIAGGCDMYFGLVKAEILPPRDILIPVLPKKIDEKLMFVLCETCAETKSEECNHRVNERSWVGTYVSEELFLAISRGYKILDLFEIWKFDRSDSLFRGYIDFFLKMKTEASGFPRDVVTIEEKERYVKDFREREGISLDLANIKKNPGLRTLAKLQLNNLWGRFGLNSDKINTKICSNYTELAELLFDATIDCKSVFVTDSKAVVDYRIKEENIKNGRYTNIPIAAFTTAYARMKLFEVMEVLGDRLLYCDTDSVVFTSSSSKKEFQPPTGSFLGDLTDEIKDAFGPNARGISFSSPGPKTYALDVECEDGQIESIIRCKGFSISNENKDLICAETMRRLVNNDIPHITVDGLVFKPGKFGGVSLIENKKVLRKTYRKRRISCTKTFRTLPWGYTNAADYI